MSLDQNLDKVVIIDFGSQFTQLIARRIRELGVFSEIVSHKKIRTSDINQSVRGIILSGGPLNVYQINKYSFDKKILELNKKMTDADRQYSLVHKYTQDDPHLNQMLKKINDDDLNNLEKIHLYYGIHKAYEDVKDFKNAFCAVRPPGHHAEKDKAMGFCIYNNVAVGANYLIEKYKYNKVAIIDFDVHHGNGTQDIFYNNEKVLYI